jgi:hypothetical protein
MLLYFSDALKKSTLFISLNHTNRHKFLKSRGVGSKKIQSKRNIKWIEFFPAIKLVQILIANGGSPIFV